ncbi:Aromatic ring-opening dioxygenase, LigB subunit [Prescottella defluvii]
MPSPPLLVPQLAGAAAAETDRLRQAALDVSARLGEACGQWTVIGVADPGAPATEIAPESRGTFAGFGVDVRVCLAPGESDRGAPDPEMPLAALVAGWLRGRVAPSVTVRARILAPNTSPAECIRVGEQLRRELDASPLPQGLLIVADGANTLTEKAPGAFDERSGAVEAVLGRALAGGDCGALDGLDAGLCGEIGLSGRAAWQTLSAVFGGADGGPRKAESLYSESPFGVGYHVGMWLP